MAILEKEEYNSILDHPKINFDSKELDRIKESFMHYKGEYPKVTYVNSLRNKREREYFYINMTKVVSKYLTKLVFNERCEINIGIPNEETGEYPKTPASDFVREVLDRTNFKKSFAEYLEPMFATGGLVVRPYYDAEQKRIEFSWCLADAFIPLKSNTNGIYEGCIPTTTVIQKDGKKYHYTLLEFHEWVSDLYVISNELYKSEESGKLGKRVSLSELVVYENLQPISTIPNLSRPLFTYIKPSDFNNINPRSPLGLGILDNSRSTVKAINDTYDEFRWEVKDGRQRTIVSDHFTRTRYDADGRPITLLDDETNAFLALPGELENMNIRDITKQIRAEEYRQALNEFKSTLEMEVGLSPNTFTITSTGGIKTATEVISEDSETFQTRNMHIGAVRDGIRDIIISTFELAKYVKVNDVPLYSGDIPTEDEIGVDFDDGVFVSRDSELEFYVKAKLNKLIPQREAIQKMFRVPPATAKEWISDMEQDELRSMPDMTQARAESSLLGSNELGD